MAMAEFVKTSARRPLLQYHTRLSAGYSLSLFYRHSLILHLYSPGVNHFPLLFGYYWVILHFWKGVQ